MTLPGIIIDRSPDPQTIYIGSPSLAVLPDGTYVASHDFFGPGTTFDTTAIFSSSDRGKTWTRAAVLDGQFWSRLFVLNDRLYIIGSTGRWGTLVVRRSDDGGRTWTEPEDPTTGLVVPGNDKHLFGIAPGATLVHEGRIYKCAVRREAGPRKWGQPQEFFVLSASVDADLLKSDSWRHSTVVREEPVKGKPWLCDEGNVVLAPDGSLQVVMRVHEPKHGNVAALLQLSDDGRTLTFDRKTGLIEFPGGCKKFTVRFDPVSRRYWSLANWAQAKDRPRARDTNYMRNTLALTGSTTLRDWQVNSVLLYDEDVRKVGFQYADWHVDGQDMIAVVRTSWGEAPDCHNANYLTFHRITDFRKRTMDTPLLTE